MMTRRDIGLRVAAGIVGSIVALIPAPYHSAPSSASRSAYEHIATLMWTPPWSFLLLGMIAVLLYRSRFDGRSYGVAFGAGAAIVKTIQNLQ